MAKPFKLAIDPGHGWANRRGGVFDSGAVVAGVAEADVVMTWGMTLAWTLFNAGIPFWLSRRDDRDPDPLATRDDRAELAGCTHFLSLHCNDSDDSLVTGTEAFYRDDADRDWALLTGRLAKSAVGGIWRGVKREGQSQHSRLAVFDFDGPCALVELGFLTNPAERARLLSRDVRLSFANGLVAHLRELAR